MSLLVPDASEVILLSYTVGKTAPGSPKLHLYTNDYTPVEGSILSNFTEATAGGSTAIVLTSANWSIATVTGTTTAQYAEQTFNLTGASTDYGYYVTDNAGTSLMWAERFSDAPHTIPSGGGTEKVTVKFQGE